jgi:predicted ArsR family transcriptional regulator
MPISNESKRRPATEEEARTLASAVRLRILRQCLDRSLTNKEIAARLGLNPATTLHHVRKLVATGFLEAQDERRGTRGAREVPYLSTGKSWTLDVHEDYAAGSSKAMLDAFIEEANLAGLDTYVEGEPLVAMTRLGIRVPQDQMKELHERMADLLNDFASRPSDPDSEPSSIFVAIYADVSRR